MRCLVLVCPLLMGFLYTGQSCTEDMLKESDACCKKCPTGYYNAGRCGVQMYTCKICGDGRFTDIPNTRDECELCITCDKPKGQKTLEACSYKNNAVCACDEGYFTVGRVSADPNCRSCTRTDCRKKECRKSFNCNLSTTTTTTMTSPLTTLKSTSKPKVSPLASASPSVDLSTTTTTTMTSPLTTLKSTPNPKVSPLTPASPSVGVLLPFIPVVSVAVLLLVGFCFVTRCYRSPEKALQFPIEDPQINEQQQQQPSSHDTQIWDGPSRIFCPILPEDPLTSALLPEPQFRGKSRCCKKVNISRMEDAPRQDKQADCWPAALHYAIIKVVPLRRWKEFLRFLSVEDRQLERVELEVSHSLGSLEKQYQMLTLWSHSPSAALEDVYSALHYMDLAGCAQQLQESLENLHWETNSRLKLVDVRQTTAA